MTRLSSFFPGWASTGDELSAVITIPSLSLSFSSASSVLIISHLTLVSTCSQAMYDLCFICLFLSNLILDLTYFSQNLILQLPPGALQGAARLRAGSPQAGWTGSWSRL